MPVTFADLLANRRTVQVEWLANTITVTYQPAAYTIGLAERVFSTPYVELIPALVVEWDLTDDDGVMVPVTAENVERLPTRLSKEIVLEIVKDNNQGEVGSS